MPSFIGVTVATDYIELFCRFLPRLLILPARLALALSLAKFPGLVLFAIRILLSLVSVTTLTKPLC